jgi:hypothetical protein
MTQNNVNQMEMNIVVVERREEEEKYENNIYRFKFTQSFMDELSQFSKVHQYDDRHIFKEAWKKWSEEDQTELIDEEIQRLSMLGYEGDILDKMFKSARYYFKNKSSIKNDAKERRTYVNISKEILDLMDLHIKSNMKADKNKPSDGFTMFCNMYKDELNKEVGILIQKNFTDATMISTKFKKTYKNRYFNITKA